MGSFTQLTYHVVFSTKYRQPVIAPSFRDRLYEYVAGTLRGKQGHAIEIGGTRDHIHILTRLSPTLAVADVIRDVKSSASKWIGELPEARFPFAWQKGYSAFTVSYWQIDSVRRYIQNQDEHHRQRSFQEEYVEFLNRHGIEFRREYLFEDEHHG